MTLCYGLLESDLFITGARRLGLHTCHQEFCESVKADVLFIGWGATNIRFTRFPVECTAFSTESDQMQNPAFMIEWYPQRFGNHYAPGYKIYPAELLQNPVTSTLSRVLRASFHCADRRYTGDGWGAPITSFPFHINECLFLPIRTRVVP